ncbi:MAG: class I mannose-6-phosphate isomerase [Clostridiales bacterium]|nr:class I mannose-6-phosphate isomerase [Clostridiales bacterium]
MYPMKLTPAFKDYLWGGARLRTEYHMQSDLDKLAEAWVLSCHKDGPSVVANGELAGMTLEAAIDKLGKDCLGTKGKAFAFFPILIKLIDAKDNLSIQVHPSDEYALRVEGEFGKTEMWYVVDCDPGAYLYYGFNREIAPDEFARRIADNTLLEVLNKVEVKKGDCFFIESGTIHAIGAGLLIAEIQQNSNTTYRVYDYGRVGADGKPRQLHVEKAKEVTQLCPPTAAYGAVQTVEGKARLASCKYFTVDKLEVRGETGLSVDGASFASLLCLEGCLIVEAAGQSVSMVPGDCVFLPASLGGVQLKGNGAVVCSRV